MKHFGEADILVIKKDGTENSFDKKKIISAINKSAERVLRKLSDLEGEVVCEFIISYLKNNNIQRISVKELHLLVEMALEEVDVNVAKAYKDYRNYKTDFVNMLDEVYMKSQKIRYIGDKENSNTDSALVSTKRSLIYNELNKEFYKKFFLNANERQACKDGYIYIHDSSARLDTLNCCIFDAKKVMSGGFEMGNMWYNEPTSILSACGVLGDIISSTASQQYGGFSVRVDDLLAPYVEKSFNTYVEEGINIVKSFGGSISYDKLIDLAMKRTQKELEQGVQILEYQLNSVGSSRGDYPFVTFSLGLEKTTFGKMVSKAFLKVRMEGQGKEGKKKQVLFPKLVFLYDENLHGEGKELEDVFKMGIECSSKSMYPDWLSLTGDGYVPSMYKKYGEVITPMGQMAHIKPCELYCLIGVISTDK